MPRYGGAEASVRVFYALWPEHALADRLAEHATVLQAGVGGRITRTDSIHLTLAFLGDVDPGRLDELRAPPAAIAVDQFALELDRLGAWHHNGIGWVAPATTPEPLADLQMRLSDWLESIGFTFDRRTFKPHVTLVRKCTGEAATVAIQSMRWSVDEYVLVRSTLDSAGSRYEVIGRFPLRPMLPP